MRERLVLGACAAAVLVAIVAFGATGGIETEPSPAPTPYGQRELFGGSLEPGVRYRTRDFDPALSFIVGDTEWLALSQPDVLVLSRRIRSHEPGSERPSRSALTFWRTRPGLRERLRRNPDLRVGPYRPVMVGGEVAESFPVAVRFTRPARPAAICRRLLRSCTRFPPNRFFPDGARLRVILLPGGLVIDLQGSARRDLERLEAPAAYVLRTLRVTRP